VVDDIASLNPYDRVDALEIARRVLAERTKREEAKRPHQDESEIVTIPEAEADHPSFAGLE
jgi:hypothetical protein